MSDIKVRGYVSKPNAKTSSRGGFSTFTLSEKVKDKSEKGFHYAFYNVTDFNNATPPADRAYVTIEGYLKPREYESNGVKRLSLDVVAQKLEVAPPRDGGQSFQSAAPAQSTEDEFGF